MKKVINNNNKYKLKFWFSMLYIHGRKFMFGPVFNYQGLSKDYFLLIYQNLGADFRAPKSGYRSQKRPVLPPLYIYIYIKEDKKTIFINCIVIKIIQV